MSHVLLHVSCLIPDESPPMESGCGMQCYAHVFRTLRWTYFMSLNNIYVNNMNDRVADMSHACVYMYVSLFGVIGTSAINIAVYVTCRPLVKRPDGCSVPAILNSVSPPWRAPCCDRPWYQCDALDCHMPEPLTRNMHALLCSAIAVAPICL